MKRWLGAHAVSCAHLYAVARVRGITAIILALVMGLWVLRHHNQLLRTPAWADLYSLLGGRVEILGWVILVGGLLGLIGLTTRARFLTTVSSVICALWFGWIGAFLWYSNFTDSPNVGAILCIYGLLEYIYRLALLAREPKVGEDKAGGW
jgi:hypothetical protein